MASQEKNRDARNAPCAGDDGPSVGDSQHALGGAGQNVNDIQQPPAFTKELLEFADNLRDNAMEARDFYADEVRERLGGDVTKKSETRFVNRLTHLARELDSRSTEFEGLQAGCPPQSPGQRIIDDLAANGLSNWLRRLANESQDKASLAGRPLSPDSLDRLDLDRRAILRNISDLVRIADWIESQARAIRNDPLPWQDRTSVLPAGISALLQQSESRAREYLQTMAIRPADVGQRTNETTLQFLQRLREEKQRLQDENQNFAAVLSKFTDEHLQAAERAGHEQLVTFLKERESVVCRVAARRGVSIALTDAAIDNFIERLSLTDEGNEAAEKIIYLLNGVKALLDEQRSLLKAAASRATESRVAAGTQECDLPEWHEIYGDGAREGTAIAGVWMVIMSFQDPTANEQEFSAATKKMLAERLAERFGGRCDDYLGSWLDRRMKKARELGIVDLLPRDEGASKTIPDRFGLCAAAIRKYRGSFPAG